MASNLVKLISGDIKTVEVEVAVAIESEMVKDVIEAKGIDEPIPLPHVSGDSLAKVMEYCRYHVESQKTSEDKPATPEDEIKAWDADFVKVDRETLFALSEAAGYLKIKNLVHLTYQPMIDTVKGKTTEEMREMLEIQNDFIPEEEAGIGREHAEWALMEATGKTAEEVQDVFHIIEKIFTSKEEAEI